MRFKAAVIISLILHVSIFALTIFVPNSKSSEGTVYYVDLINMPGGGGGGGKSIKNVKAGPPPQEARMKDLTTQKQETQSKLRYPDENLTKKKKNTSKKKKEKKQLITMSRKNRKKKDKIATVTRKNNSNSNVLRTGISAGSGGGSGGGYGGGSGSGYGAGSGSGISFFPYAYYIETLRSKVSASWYNGLVSPGQRGEFLVTVDFKILRTGEISDLKVRKKSGIPSLDLSALRAIENAAPFGELPSDYTKSYLPVSFDFVWGKNENKQ